MKPVAVSQRVDEYVDRKEVRDALDQQLVKFLMSAGYMPIPISNALLGDSNEQYFERWVAHVKPAAIVLSGGNDLGSNDLRDTAESRFLDYAEGERIPVLGICRGMQMMGVRAGSELVPVKGHVCTHHKLLGEIVGDVNSYHDFSLATCPDSYLVVARSADGVIEAIRHRDLPWEGWMWHPERVVGFEHRDIRRIQKLFG